MKTESNSVPRRIPLAAGLEFEPFRKLDSPGRPRGTPRPWPDGERALALKNFFVLAPLAAILAAAIILIWIGLS